MDITLACYKLYPNVFISYFWANKEASVMYATKKMLLLKHWPLEYQSLWPFLPFYVILSALPWKSMLDSSIIFKIVKSPEVSLSLSLSLSLLKLASLGKYYLCEIHLDKYKLRRRIGLRISVPVLFKYSFGISLAQTF